jgi:hypothetical protein
MVVAPDFGRLPNTSGPRGKYHVLRATVQAVGVAPRRADLPRGRELFSDDASSLRRDHSSSRRITEGRLLIQRDRVKGLLFGRLGATPH